MPTASQVRMLYFGELYQFSNGFFFDIFVYNTLNK